MWMCFALDLEDDTLLDFFGSKFCKKCECSFSLISVFYLVNSLRWTPLGSEKKRVFLKEMSVYKGSTL